VTTTRTAGNKRTSTRRIPWRILTVVVLCWSLAGGSVVGSRPEGDTDLVERIAKLEALVRELSGRVARLEGDGATAEEPPAETAEPPTEEQIGSVVKTYLAQADPMPLEFTPTIMGCNKARVGTFRVIDLGQAQSAGSTVYWPVRVHVTGECTTAFGKVLPFDKTGVFDIHQDAFGDWKGRVGRQ